MNNMQNDIMITSEDKNTQMFDIKNIRAQFPILQQKVNGKPLVYLDNGASSQKPKVVIDAIEKCCVPATEKVKLLLP